jgi:replicative DNA helicase
MDKRLPPANVEAEMQTIGAAILAPQWQGIEDIFGVVGPEDFTRSDHIRIMHAVIAEFRSGAATCEASAIAARLRRSFTDQPDVGEKLVETMIACMEGTSSYSAGQHYAGMVADAALRRNLIERAGIIAERAYGDQRPAKEQLIEAEAELLALNIESQDRAVRRLGPIAADRIEKARKVKSGEIKDDRLYSGISNLDEILTTIRPGALIVLAGDTSMGKSALALNIAENIAVAGNPAAFFTIEMSGSELAERILASRSNVAVSVMNRPHTMTDQEWGALDDAAASAAQTPLWIADTPGLSIEQFMAVARRAVRKHGVKALFLDYLQIMSYADAMREVDSIRNITAMVKQTARSLNVPVVLVSQLRKKEQGVARDREPTLDDLHGSGSIKKDADAVIFVHRPEHYHAYDHAWLEANPQVVGKAKLIVAKQRGGRLGECWVDWDGERTKFTSDPSMGGIL